MSSQKDVSIITTKISMVLGKLFMFYNHFYIYKIGNVLVISNIPYK